MKYKELIEEAGLVYQPNKELDWLIELVVRKCAKVAFNDWCEGTNEEESSRRAILEHFGLK